MMPDHLTPRIHIDCSEHPCAAVLRAEYEARCSHDLAAFALLLTRDVTWHVPGDNAIAGIYRGINDVLAYVQVRQRLSGGTFEMTIEDVVANDRHGFVVASGRALLGGRFQRWRAHGLYRFRDGQIAACWVLPEDQREFDRIWAEEALTGWD